MITIEDVTFSYESNEDLFHKLKLHLNAGVICGLLGKNGAGKTTLLRLIAGLLFPQKGECHVLNHEPRQRFPQFLQEIYFLPEEFYVPAITAQAYIDLFSPFYSKFNHQDFLRFAHEFDLPLDKRLNIFSYGQKKKFLVAFGLATNCSLLLFDEPTNGLDIPSKSQFRKLLAANLTDEKTVIISTHQVRDLQNLLDTIVILDNGEIVFNHSILEISKKISFMQKPILTQKDEEDSLYVEKTLGGYMFMQKAGNEDNQQLEIDLEILFNAIMFHRNKINNLF